MAGLTLRDLELTGTAWRLAGIAVGLAAAAINTGNNLLYLLLGLVIGAVPVAAAAVWLNLSKLSVELGAPRTTVAGGAWTVEVRLRRQRRSVARGLEIEIEASSGAPVRAWVERLEGSESRRLAIPGARSPRGVLTLERVVLRSSFPLGIVRCTRRFLCRQEVLMLPRSTPFAVAAAGCAVTGAEGSPQLRQGLFEVTSDDLRRGDDAEDLRRVDWKATAHRGELMLREHAAESARQTHLDLSTRLADASERSWERFEREVSRIAGLGRAALEAGGALTLTVDGRDRQRWSGPAGVVSFLSRLARVVPRDPAGRQVLRASGVERATSPVPPGRSGLERGHRAVVLATAAIGVVTLFAYEGIGLLSFALLTGAFVAVTTTHGRLVASPGSRASFIWNVLASIALAAFAAELVWQRNPLSAAITLVVFITLYLLFNARTPRDDRLLLLVSLMQLVLGAALTTDVTFALPLATWLVLALLAQVLWTSAAVSSKGEHRAQLRDVNVSRWEPLRIAGLTAGAIACSGLAAFAVIPHLGTGAFDPGAARARRVSGFSEMTELGNVGSIELDSRPVMEVVLRGVDVDPADLHWRGIALEDFDGRTWRRSWTRPEELPIDGRPWSGTRLPRTILEQEIRLEPAETPVIFAAERPLAISSSDLVRLSRDEAGDLEARTRRGRRGIRYTVQSEPIPRDPARLRQANGREPPELLEKNLALPELDPRIARTAQRIVAGATTRYDAARALEEWVASGRSYSLEVEDANRTDPLAAFLFEGMAGHCEYFATGMVVLARSAGIPARFVKGYLGGDANRFSDSYLVRQSDAHAWVEVHFPGIGWVPFDPTPPAAREVGDELSFLDLLADLYATVRTAWDDHLIGVDLNDQYVALLAVRDRLLLAANALRQRVTLAAGLLALALATTAAIAFFVRWTRRRRREAQVPSYYRELLRWLARKGFERKPAETPHELAARAAEVLPADVGTRVEELTRLYYRERFSGDRRAQIDRTRTRELLAGLGP